MNIELGALTIKLDVLIVQIINIGILFWLFKKFAGNLLITEIQKRKALLSKLENVDKEYAHMMNKADEEKKLIIDEAKKQKQQIFQEAILSADQKKVQILEKADTEAENIIQNAHQEVKKLENELTSQWEDSVKKTTQMVVKKLIHSDAQLKEQYIQQLIQEVKKTR